MGYLTEEKIERAAAPDGFDPLDGAAVEFQGIVRGVEQDQPIEALLYEAYIPMAEQVIGQWVAQAKRRWPLHRVDVVHRVGTVGVGEISVRIAVQSPHRDEAFAACRFLIDQIKAEAPIWKTGWVYEGKKVRTKDFVCRAS